MARRSLYVFTAEMALKIVAQGFVLNRGAYLRDVWNWLDFTVVVSGWVASVLARELSGDSNDLSAISALRAIRVLRPLRTINRVPGMKVLVRSLLGAIPAMASVLLLCGFIFLVFGIIGVQLYSGSFRQQCFEPGPNGGLVLAGGDEPIYCSKTANDSFVKNAKMNMKAFLKI